MQDIDACVYVCGSFNARDQLELEHQALATNIISYIIIYSVMIQYYSVKYKHNVCKVYTGKFWQGKILVNHTGKHVGEEKFGK